MQSHRGSNTLTAQQSAQIGNQPAENEKQPVENQGKKTNDQLSNQPTGKKTENDQFRKPVQKPKQIGRKAEKDQGGKPVQTDQENEGRKCEILNWDREVIAKGTLMSTDPEALVHFKKLGSQGWKVWIDAALDPEAFLWRPNSAMTTIGEAVGSTVAWNKNYVAFS